MFLVKISRKSRLDLLTGGIYSKSSIIVEGYATRMEFSHNTCLVMASLTPALGLLPLSAGTFPFQEYMIF